MMKLTFRKSKEDRYNDNLKEVNSRLRRLAKSQEKSMKLLEKQSRELDELNERLRKMTFKRRFTELDEVPKLEIIR